MHNETYCGRRVVHVETHGVMDVYQIPDHRKMQVCKYMVFNNKTGRTLEPFRRKRDAISWAKENQKG
jgi:hypothetical protein